MFNLDNQQPRIRRIFIDCTVTRRYDTNTGIQRVVRNVLNNAARIGLELGLECRGVAFSSTAGFETIDQLTSPSARRSVAREVVTKFHHEARIVLRSWLEATNLLDLSRWFKHRVLHRAQHQLLSPVRRVLRTGLRLRRGDVLLLADNSWDPNFPWDEVRQAQSRGALIGLVLYDLIPLRNPNLIAPDLCQQFREWWYKVRNMADFVIGISENVLADLDAVEEAACLAGFSPVTPLRRSFRLGAELEGTLCGGSIRDGFRAAFENDAARTTYLMVGMISRRKNYGLALDAFERLWSHGARVNLAIAGKSGCDCSDVIDRLRRHPQFGKKLFWFDDARDKELDYCYRHAAGLITTSCAEGFNLPIVEALKHGCPVLASDLAVHREVGGAHAAFFTEGDAASLVELVRQHQSRGRLEGVKSPADFRWPDWPESCRKLLEQVIELGTASPSLLTSGAQLASVA